MRKLRPVPGRGLACSTSNSQQMVELQFKLFGSATHQMPSKLLFLSSENKDEADEGKQQGLTQQHLCCVVECPGHAMQIVFFQSQTTQWSRASHQPMFLRKWRLQDVLFLGETNELTQVRVWIRTRFPLTPESLHIPLRLKFTNPHPPGSWYGVQEWVCQGLVWRDR